jgi:hypothetical protein
MTFRHYLDAWLRSAKAVCSVTLFTNYGKQWNMTPISDHPRAPMCSSPLFVVMLRMHGITSAVLDIPHFHGSRQGRTGGHGGAMWKVIVSDGLLLAANKGTPEARCEDELFDDQPLPFGAEIGSSIAEAGTAAVFSTMERDAHRIFVTTVTGTKETLFVLLVLYIFATLPRVGSIDLTVVWFCGGPWLLRSDWSVIHACASHPNTLLAFVSAYTLVSTKVFQSVGLALGLDLNRDGSVDARDVFYELITCFRVRLPLLQKAACRFQRESRQSNKPSRLRSEMPRRWLFSSSLSVWTTSLTPRKTTAIPRGPTQKEFDDLKQVLAETSRTKKT